MHEKLTFIIYDFPSVASAMWVCMYGVVRRTAVKDDLNGSGFKDWSLLREAGFLTNLGICESVYPVDSVEYGFV